MILNLILFFFIQINLFGFFLKNGFFQKQVLYLLRLFDNYLILIIVLL